MALEEERGRFTLPGGSQRHYLLLWNKLISLPMRMLRYCCHQQREQGKGNDMPKMHGRRVVTGLTREEKEIRPQERFSVLECTWMSGNQKMTYLCQMVYIWQDSAATLLYSGTERSELGFLKLNQQPWTVIDLKIDGMLPRSYCQVKYSSAGKFYSVDFIGAAIHHHRSFKDYNIRL